MAFPYATTRVLLLSATFVALTTMYAHAAAPAATARRVCDGVLLPLGVGVFMGFGVKLRFYLHYRLAGYIIDIYQPRERGG